MSKKTLGRRILARPERLADGADGAVGPTGAPGQDVDPATVDALTQQLDTLTQQLDVATQQQECQRIVIALLTGDALKFKTRRGVVTVELDLGKAARLGVDLAEAIACTNLVYPDNDVVLKGGKGSSKNGSSKSKSKS